MFGRLIELILPRVIGVVFHKYETLTKKELRAQYKFMERLNQKSTVKNPIVVAMVGLVGSGKSSVAAELAKRINAVVINGDEIRIKLRKQNARYEKARAIAENAAIKIVKGGGSVILDSDFVDEKKRASIREKAREAGVQIIFIRTYCDTHVVLGRIFNATYHNSIDDFFGGASSAWEGPNKGAVVKASEMRRRTPHHYRWVNQCGGKWILKKFPFTIFVEIDTIDSSSWKLEVSKCAKRLLMK